MGNLTLTTTACLLGFVLAPPIASQAETTSKPQKPKPDDEAQKQARRWVTFLELDNRRAEAADALLKMDAKAVPALVQALDDPRPVVAQTVAHILRVLGSQAASAKERLVALSNSDDKQRAYLARYALAGIQPAGVTLVVDLTNSKVLEIGKTGKVVRTLMVVGRPFDADRLPNGNYLICVYSDKKVVEMTAKGKVVWSFATLEKPFSAQRLPNGNTLITDWLGVLEVDRGGKTVWKYGKGSDYRDAERLVNGNTLIVDEKGGQVIEVTHKGEIAWRWRGGLRLMDADRLPNGNTQIVEAGNNRVIEVTPKGKVVWELKGLKEPLLKQL